MVTQLGNDDIMIKITQPSHLANQTQCILSCYQGASGTRKYRSAMSFYRKPPISCHRGLATCISWILDFTTWVVLSISSSYPHKPKVSSNHPMPDSEEWAPFLSRHGKQLGKRLYYQVSLLTKQVSLLATVVTTKFLYYRNDVMLWFMSYSLCHVGDSGARVKSWGHTKLSIIILSTLRAIFFIYLFWGGADFQNC